MSARGSARRQRWQFDCWRGAWLWWEIDADGFFLGLNLACFLFWRNSTDGHIGNVVSHNVIVVQDRRRAQAVKLLFGKKHERIDLKCMLPRRVRNILKEYIELNSCLADDRYLYCALFLKES